MKQNTLASLLTLLAAGTAHSGIPDRNQAAAKEQFKEPQIIKAEYPFDTRGVFDEEQDKPFQSMDEKITINNRNYVIWARREKDLYHYIISIMKPIARDFTNLTKKKTLYGPQYIISIDIPESTIPVSRMEFPDAGLTVSNIRDSTRLTADAFLLGTLAYTDMSARSTFPMLDRLITKIGSAHLDARDKIEKDYDTMRKYFSQSTTWWFRPHVLEPRIAQITFKSTVPVKNILLMEEDTLLGRGSLLHYGLAAKRPAIVYPRVKELNVRAPLKEPLSHPGFEIYFVYEKNHGEYRLQIQCRSTEEFNFSMGRANGINEALISLDTRCEDLTFFVLDRSRHKGPPDIDDVCGRGFTGTVENGTDGIASLRNVLSDAKEFEKTRAGEFVKQLFRSAGINIDAISLLYQNQFIKAGVEQLVYANQRRWEEIADSIDADFTNRLDVYAPPLAPSELPMLQSVILEVASKKFIPMCTIYVKGRFQGDTNYYRYKVNFKNGFEEQPEKKPSRNIIAGGLDISDIIAANAGRKVATPPEHKYPPNPKEETNSTHTVPMYAHSGMNCIYSIHDAWMNNSLDDIVILAPVGNETSANKAIEDLASDYFRETELEFVQSVQSKHRFVITPYLGGRPVGGEIPFYFHRGRWYLGNRRGRDVGGDHPDLTPIHASSAVSAVQIAASGLPQHRLSLVNYWFCKGPFSINEVLANLNPVYQVRETYGDEKQLYVEYQGENVDPLTRRSVTSMPLYNDGCSWYAGTSTLHSKEIGPMNINCFGWGNRIFQEISEMCPY